MSLDDANFSPAAEGQVLSEGATVRTGADGRASIEYFDGSVTRLDRGTTFKIVTMQILDNDEQSKVIEGEQTSGNTYNRVTELTDAASRFDIETPTATASVQGTVYAVLVNADGSTTVAVIEGSVDAGDGPVPAGFMVTVDEDGNVSDPIPIPDDLLDDDWIVYNCEIDGGPHCPDDGTTTTTTTVPPTTTTTVAATTTTTVPSSTTTTVAPPPVTTTVPPATTTTVPPTTTTTTVPVLSYIVISPSDSTISTDEAEIYSAEAFDTNGESMGDVTNETVFEISPAGGRCRARVCDSPFPGEYTVTGTYLGAFQDTASLTVESGDLDLGSGDVEVFLSWNNDDDLDLWVTEPGATCNGNEGEVIGYTNLGPTLCGGQLDHDAIPCGQEVDQASLEHTYWPTGPAGTYVVRVDYFSGCAGSTTATYNLRVYIDGGLVFNIVAVLSANQEHIYEFTVE